MTGSKGNRGPHHDHRTERSADKSVEATTPAYEFSFQQSPLLYVFGLVRLGRAPRGWRGLTGPEAFCMSNMDWFCIVTLRFCFRVHARGLVFVGACVHKDKAFCPLAFRIRRVGLVHYTAASTHPVLGLFSR